MYLSFLSGLLVKVSILFRCLAASRVYSSVLPLAVKLRVALLITTVRSGSWFACLPWVSLPSCGIGAARRAPRSLQVHRRAVPLAPRVWAELWGSPWSSSAAEGHKLLLSRDARSLVWRPPGPRQPGLFPSGLHCGARGGKAQSRALRRGAVHHGNTTGPLLTKVLTKPPTSSNGLSVGSLTFQVDWEVVFRQEQSGCPPASSRCPLVLSPRAVRI